LTTQISNSKKDKYEMHTHFTNFGKQAMARPSVLQLKNQSLSGGQEREQRELKTGAFAEGSQSGDL